MMLGTVATLLATAAVASAQVGVSGATTPFTSWYSADDIANGNAFRNVSEMARENMIYNIDHRSNATCTFRGANVRKEWRTMGRRTRKSFTDAVTCLQSLPPRYMTADEAPSYPGVKTRHDEYVATHINYTYNIHDTADFFSFHRAFIHFYEQDLKNSCGYNGYLPYWNWALDAAAPQDSPLFSGDAYSMGSNGAFIANRSNTYLALQDVDYTPGTGGGCVFSGPFTNYTVNLGPLDLPNTNNVNSSYEYNPRCLIRDLNPWFSTRYNTFTNITTTLLDNLLIEDFQSVFQGYGSGTDKFGLHGGGHWTGGGSMADFHSSPSDPLFFLHHGMVDRLWTIWQNLDIYRRQNTISGTSTLGNSPPSAEMTLNDTIPFGFVAPSQRFGDLMDTMGGGLWCYRYE